MGRVYVGDSKGTISIWEVVYDGELKISKIKSISHRFLEGDEINSIKLDPLDKQKLIVHSRDNTIRLINPNGRNGKCSIEIEYKGLLCNQTNLKSTVSSDGQYIISGNEKGTPKIWHLLTGFPIEKSKNLECNFIDFVSDISWNYHFNMIALSGFSQEYPIMIFVYEKSQDEIEKAMINRNSNNLNINNDYYFDENLEIENMISKSGGAKRNSNFGSKII